MMTIDLNKLRSMHDKLYTSAAQTVFGNAGATALKQLLSSIVQIYARLDPSIRQHPLAIFADAKIKPSVVAGAITHLQSVDNLSHEIDGPSLVRVGGNGSLQIVPLDLGVLEALSSTAVVYLFTPSGEKFLIGGETYDVENVVVGYPSAFCKPTFGTLKAALEDYRVRQAAHSTCYVLEGAWADKKRWWFKNKPEWIMRRSLTQFLRSVLRDATVQPEQNVDETHPVDIHVSFLMTTQHAIIEIKWLGQSVKVDGTPGTGYSENRARDGAKQLAKYLDATHQSSPHHGARGYLVLFDGRRDGLKEGMTELDKDKALHYEHAHIAYNPDHSAIRSDFEPPVRMFLYPQLA